ESLLANLIVILFAAVFFIEAQSIFIEGMFRADVEPAFNVTNWVKRLALIAIPIAAIVTWFSAQLGEWVKASIDSGAPGPRLVAFVMQASIWGAAAALPLMIWVIYLYLAYWGIIDDYQAASGAHTPTWLLAMANAVSSRVFDFLGYTLPESVSLRLADRPII